MIVLHQPNRCVSAARNAGLAVSSGAWIGWVDSDDWIEPEMFADMLACAVSDSVEIVVCGRVEHFRSGNILRVWEEKTILNIEQALRYLLENERMQNFLWDKLWRRELFKNIIFPEGRTFEDISVMHRLFARAGQVACLPGAAYHYVQRAGSIVDDTSLENRLNHYLAAKLRLEEMHQDWPQLVPLMKAQCVASAITILCAYYANPGAERRRFRQELEEAAAFAKKYLCDARELARLGMAGRIVLRLTPYAKWWAFALAGVVGWLYKCRHGRAL